jgi:hypothetical protein
LPEVIGRYRIASSITRNPTIGQDQVHTDDARSVWAACHHHRATMSCVNHAHRHRCHVHEDADRRGCDLDYTSYDDGATAATLASAAAARRAGARKAIEDASKARRRRSSQSPGTTLGIDNVIVRGTRW